MSFVHLHVHSEYSLLEASSRVKALAKKAGSLGMSAIALTDNGNMFGAIEFYFAAKDAGLKPILGMETYLAPGSRFDKQADRDSFPQQPRRVVLLATSLKGYRNLCRISTIGFQEGFYWKPRVDYEVLQKYSEDLICLSGGLRGEVADTFLKEGAEAAEAKILKLKEIFADRFYLEMNRTFVKEWDEINPFLLEKSKQLSIPIVATNDVHFLTQDDLIGQEVLVCIGTNKTLTDEHRQKLGSDQFYLKSAEQMQDLFSDLPEAIENTVKIAEQCDLKFVLKDQNGKAIYHLPSYPTSDGKSLQDEIRSMAFAGLNERFKEMELRKEATTPEMIERYQARLEFELGVISKMGFNGYFLIVQDFINWAKNHDIPVGPGRGSGAGSLVAYTLRITDLDPMPYSLLFERFLNPERISMPDFDIDFCQDRRQEVIQYVTQKYGTGSVSQIITYGRLQARAALKDVGRVLGMTFPEVDAVTKLIPDKLGIHLQEAIDLEPRLKEMGETNPTIQTLLELALKIEGLVRNAGIHAAGVIIADGNLVDHAPLYRGNDGENVVQYDMKHAEKIGLIKFDFLGLKTLTHIQHALKIIEKSLGKIIRPQDISLHDTGIYEIMSRGDTAGIFQFEGDGITDAIRKIKPTNFFDITAINALYRPGPMAMIPEFAKRKHGESVVEYLIEDTKEILEETYGIIVYQEQVMGIASKVAGYSLGEADMLRRAMGKKIKEEMDQHRIRFLKGAKERGHDEKKSEELFELMYKFADYGFNKSHAAAYCVIAAQTAWLKNYYPAAFFAALLSTEMGDTDKVVKYVKDAQKRGLKVLSPSVNHSEYLFTVVNNEIFFGMGAIKGVGENAVMAIVEARDALPEKKFASIDEFFSSVDPKKLNKKVIECLIKAGAFDCFGISRAILVHNYPRYVDRAVTLHRERSIGQTSLFDLGPSNESDLVLEDVAPWSRAATLAFEKEVLGFYLSDHPLKGFDQLSRIWITGSIAELACLQTDGVTSNDGGAGARSAKKRVIIHGLISDLREVITKKGTRMAFAKMEDFTGHCEIVVFPDMYSRFEGVLKDERPLLLAGLLEVEEGQAKIIVDNVSPLDDMIRKSKRLLFRLGQIEFAGEHETDELNAKYRDLSQTFADFPGDTSVTFELEVPEIGKIVTLEKEGRGIVLSSELFERIYQRFGTTSMMELKS